MNRHYRHSAWLLFSYRVENGRPIITGVGIFSEATPTGRLGQGGYLQHSVASGETFAEAKANIMRMIQGPHNDWIRAALSARGEWR